MKGSISLLGSLSLPTPTTVALSSMLSEEGGRRGLRLRCGWDLSHWSLGRGTLCPLLPLSEQQLSCPDSSPSSGGIPVSHWRRCMPRQECGWAAPTGSDCTALHHLSKIWKCDCSILLCLASLLRRTDLSTSFCRFQQVHGGRLGGLGSLLWAGIKVTDGHSHPQEVLWEPPLLSPVPLCFSALSPHAARPSQRTI